jgi:hypothetical protein
MSIGCGSRVSTKVLARLRRVARRWGGDILVLTEKKYDDQFEFTLRAGFSGAPFTSRARLGVFYARKQVVLVPSSELNLMDVLHELAHVFASKKSPNNADEYNFLGWEWAFAHRLGVSRREWQRGLANYQLGDEPWSGQTIDRLTSKQLTALIVDRLAKAKESGIVSLCGVPQSIRSKK